MSKAEYVIDGKAFSTLEEFFHEIGHKLFPGVKWGHNLDAFNDILRGGFGTPEGGFVLRWKNAELSREQLGYQETVRQLKLRLRQCHPSNHVEIEKQIACALRQEGPTVFDWIVDIIREHGPGGAEEADGVELVLE